MSSKPIMCAFLTSLCVLVGVSAQAPKGELPPAVNRVLTMLPAPPKLETPPPQEPPPAQSTARPPAPPPPQSRHFDIPLVVQASTGGVYYDFGLPAGRIAGMRWVAVGAGNVNVTPDIEVTVMSPSMFVRPSPSGGTELFINQGGGNVRAIARKKKAMGAVRITLSLDFDQS
jgi:hypothetical protein